MTIERPITYKKMVPYINTKLTWLQQRGQNIALSCASNQRERERGKLDLGFQRLVIQLWHIITYTTFRTSAFLISNILFLPFLSFVQPIFSLQIKAFKMLQIPKETMKRLSTYTKYRNKNACKCYGCYEKLIITSRVEGI